LDIESDEAGVKNKCSVAHGHVIGFRPAREAAGVFETLQNFGGGFDVRFRRGINVAVVQRVGAGSFEVESLFGKIKGDEVACEEVETEAVELDVGVAGGK